MDCRIIEIDSMKTQNIKKTPYRLVLILLLFISELSSAQPSFGEGGDDVHDVPVNSIDYNLWSVLVIVLIVIIVFFRKKTTNQV
jgi:hypothetical protein